MARDDYPGIPYGNIPVTPEEDAAWAEKIRQSSKPVTGVVSPTPQDPKNRKTGGAVIYDPWQVRPKTFHS